MVFNTGAAGDVEASQYQIARSLRFDHLSNSYLTRMPVATGERRAFTFSGWLKRTNLGNSTGGSLYLFNAQQASNSYFIIYFHNSALDTFSVTQVVAGVTKMQRRTSAVARDPAAWFHLCVSADTRPAVPTCIIECNGVVLPPTVVNTNAWVQDELLWVNYTGIPNYFGCYGSPTPNLFSAVYLAEAYLIDGQALAASSFGRTDAATGTWIPKPYIGTYGTNGAYLKFADNSNTTAATLGKDSSGNNNNFTPTNFSVAAGIGNDSLVDTPTNYGTDAGVGGELRGNYCVLNSTDMTTIVTTYEGNLAAQGGNASTWSVIRGTVWVNSGKWYWEAVPSNITAGMVGVLNNATAIAGGTNLHGGLYPGGYAYYNNGQKYNNNVGAAYGATYTTNDVIGIALDMTAGTITFYKNGVSQGVAYSGLSGYFAPAFSLHNSGYWLPNFGQRPFAYAAPSGFKVLCSANMPSTTPDLPASFAGNGLVDGPFVWANGVTNAVTINGNVATRGTHFDGVAGGIKLRTNSGSYNTAGTNTVTAETPGISFKYSRAQPNG